MNVKRETNFTAIQSQPPPPPSVHKIVNITVGGRLLNPLRLVASARAACANIITLNAIINH